MKFWKDRLFWQLLAAYTALAAAALYLVLSGVEYLAAVLATTEGIQHVHEVVAVAGGVAVGGCVVLLSAEKARALRGPDDITHGGK